MKRSVWVIVGLAVFLLILARLGVRDTVIALKNVHGGYLLLGIFITVLAQQVIPFLKWLIMADRSGLGIGPSRVLFLSSSILMGGIISPARTGEFITALFFQEKKGALSSIVFFNRVVESSITFIMALLVFSMIFTSFIDARSWLTMGLLLGGILLFFYLIATRRMFAVFFLSLGKRILLRLKNIRIFQGILALEERIVKELEHFYESMGNLFSTRPVVLLILLTVLSWLIMVFGNWALLKSVSLDVPLTIILGSMILAAIASFVSPTPGGIGLGDIPPVYFLYVHGYRENIGAYLILGRAASYVVALGWYFLTSAIYQRCTPAKDAEEVGH